MGLGLAALGIIIALAGALAWGAGVPGNLHGVEAILGLAVFGLGAAVDHLKDIAAALRK